MESFLPLLAAQGGIPKYVWIIAAAFFGLIWGALLLYFSIKSFWISKTIAFLLGIVGVVICIMALNDVEHSLFYAIAGGVVMTVCHIYIMGASVFDSDTEADYLIAGSLVHEGNHPFRAFFVYLIVMLLFSAITFVASYFWTFIIGLVVFGLILLRVVHTVIKHLGE